MGLFHASASLVTNTSLGNESLAVQTKLIGGALSVEQVKCGPTDPNSTDMLSTLLLDLLPLASSVTVISGRGTARCE